MPIKRATQFADVMEIIPVARRMHAESVYGRTSLAPFDEDALGETLWALTTNPDDGVVVMAQSPDGILKGFKFGTAHQLFFSRARVAQEMALYVAPEFRGGFTCAALIKEFERWAIEVGTVEIVIGIAAMIDNELTTKLYERLGYTQHGPILKKVLSSNVR